MTLLYCGHRIACRSLNGGPGSAGQHTRLELTSAGIRTEDLRHSVGKSSDRLRTISVWSRFAGAEWIAVDSVWQEPALEFCWQASSLRDGSGEESATKLGLLFTKARLLFIIVVVAVVRRPTGKPVL